MANNNKNAGAVEEEPAEETLTGEVLDAGEAPTTGSTEVVKLLIKVNNNLPGDLVPDPDGHLVAGRLAIKVGTDAEEASQGDAQ